MTSVSFGSSVICDEIMSSIRVTVSPQYNYSFYKSSIHMEWKRGHVLSFWTRVEPMHGRGGKVPCQRSLDQQPRCWFQSCPGQCLPVGVVMFLLGFTAHSIVCNDDNVSILLSQNKSESLDLRWAIEISVHRHLVLSDGALQPP